MDSPLVSSIFRSLFHHRACLLRRLPPASPQHHLHHLRRRGLNGVGIGVSSRSMSLSSRGGQKPKRITEVEWQPRSIEMYQDLAEEFETYPMVTAEGLVNRKQRPKRVKMWARDFIDG